MLGVLLASVSLLDLQTLQLDARLKWAPRTTPSDKVVVIRVTPYDLQKWQRNTRLMVGSSVLFEASDEYYWEEPLWADLLRKLRAAEPQKIGVSLYFGPYKTQERNREIFEDPLIVWGVPRRSDPSMLPAFATYNRSNVGALNIAEDFDGQTRRYSSMTSEVGDFFEKLAGRPANGHLLRLSFSEKDLTIIDAYQILNNEIPPEQIKGRIILIGRSLNETNQHFVTPLGNFSRLGLSAVILENWVLNKWIRVLPAPAYLLYFFILALVIVWLISRYPHKVALVLLMFLAFLMVLFSTWVFDLKGLWLPITGVIVQILTTWILFLGYSLNRMEMQTQKLKEEKQLHQELEELKINFVSLISHDLKTPIAKIQAVIARLVSEYDDPVIKSELSKVESYSKDLNRYIQNVLKLLQIETSQFKIRAESVDINSLIETVIQELNPIATTKNLAIQTKLSPLFSIEGDEQLLREVLINLIQNAIQYSGTDNKILVESLEESDYVIVKIQDYGEGINPAELPFLFDKFFRGKNSAISQQGSGLGLFLVKYFVELHNGRIYIESLPKKGTLVTLWLPFEQENTESTPTES